VAGSPAARSGGARFMGLQACLHCAWTRSASVIWSTGPDYAAWHIGSGDVIKFHRHVIFNF